jgi:hypothetical protein
LNRFAYTLNNPLRYIDPTGHFEDDALKAYLQDLYGEEWESYWNNWTKDDAWMQLLHAAESGDMLSRITASPAGMAQIEQFSFIGLGNTRLDAVARWVGDGGFSPANLNEIYSNRGEHSGIAAYGPSSNGDIVVKGTVGEVSTQVRKVTGDEVRYKGIVIGWAMPGIIGVACPPLGASLGFWLQALSPETGQLPGNVEGDNQLTIGTFYPTGDPDSFYGTPITPGTRSGYEFTFRQGTLIDRSGYSQSVYVPHRR